MTTLSEPLPRRRLSVLPLRYAFRELRGGLCGFYVFIACIALGVLAIAGVGSVAASSARGWRARAARCSAATSRFADPARGQAGGTGLSALARTSVAGGDAARHGAHHRRPAGAGRIEGGRRRLSGAGQLTLDPTTADAGRCWPSATARSAPRPTPRCWRGSTSKSAIASRSARRRSRSAACSAASPTSCRRGSVSGRAFLISEDALRATDLLQPGTLVRWTYRVVLPQNTADDRGAQAAGR